MESFSKVITMNIKYEITLEDYLEYYRSLSKYNFSRFWVRWIVRPLFIGSSLIFGIAGILYSSAYYNYYYDKKIYLISLLFISCFCLVAGIVLLFVFNAKFIAISNYNYFKNYNQKKQSLIGKRNISIYKNGLNLDAKTFHIFLDWQIFNYFSETDILFVLYFHSKQFQLIPKRCFENSEEVDRFRELLKNRAKKLDNNYVITEKIAEKNCIIKLEYQLEAEDYLEAKQAKIFPKKWLILFWLIVITTVLWSGFYTLWKDIYKDSDRNTIGVILNDFITLGIGFYLLLIYYPKINIFERKKIAKNWNSNKQMQSDRKLIVKENEIILMSDYFKESIAKQEYIKFIETKKIFLLYYSQNDYQIIPKKAFKSEEETNQFRKIIEAP